MDTKDMRSETVEEDKFNNQYCENIMEIGKIVIGPHIIYKN